MPIFFDKVLGCYYPSFFRIQLNEHTLIDLNKSNRNALNVYFHEYLHFYQDTCTIYGLQNICHSINIISSINQKIPDFGSFNVPIKISSSEVTGTNIDLQSIYLGDNDIEISENWEIIDIKSEENGLVENFEEIPNINVLYRDNGKNSSFLFGSVCVLESMACEIDKYIFDDYSNPEFPYNVCRKILDYYYQNNKFEEKYKNRVLLALCDVSLNSFHPAEHFLRMIGILQSEKTLLINDIYRIADQLTVNWKGNRISNLDLMYEMSTIAKNQLEKIINRQTHKELVEWSAELLDSGRVLRQKINFINTICRKKSETERIHCFNKTINYLGTPIILDKNGDVGFENPHRDCGEKSFYLIGVQSILNLLQGKDIKCESIANCKKTNTPMFDENICKNEPWRQVNNDLLCPYAQVWTTWGLQSKTPKFNK